MRPFCCAVGLAPVLALTLLVAAPADAGMIESSACKRDLSAASAGVSASKARLKGLTKGRAEEKCAAYRAQFLVIVKARAVVASCKTGSDRNEEVDLLDGTIEDLNGAIAENCAIQ